MAEQDSVNDRWSATSDRCAVYRNLIAARSDDDIAKSYSDARCGIISANKSPEVAQSVSRSGDRVIDHTFRSGLGSRAETPARLGGVLELA